MNNIIKKIFNEHNFKSINLYEYPKVKLQQINLKNLEKLKNINLYNKKFIFTDKYVLKSYIDKIDLYIPDEKQRNIEYFVVVSLRNPKLKDLEELIKKDFNRIFTDIKSSDYYNSYMDKNISLIVLLQLDSSENNITNSDFSKKIFDIEENKYNFKKYVLTYDKSQVKNLEERIKDSECILDTINKIVYNTEEFTTFKYSPDKSSIYSLVSKLYIKLPFLKLNVMEKNMKSLKNEINEELKLIDYGNLIDEIISIDDVSNLSDEEIISLI